MIIVWLLVLSQQCRVDPSCGRGYHGSHLVLYTVAGHWHELSTHEAAAALLHDQHTFHTEKQTQQTI